MKFEAEVLSVTFERPSKQGEPGTILLRVTSDSLQVPCMGIGDILDIERTGRSRFDKKKKI